MTDIEKSIAKLQRCFPGSYITDRNELIVHPRTNQYIILENIGTEDAIKAKVLEWLSRAAFKTAPYSQEWRNRKFHKYMRDGINAFLDTDFSEDDMELIYTYMGLACDHWLTITNSEQSIRATLLSRTVKQLTGLCVFFSAAAC